MKRRFSSFIGMILVCAVTIAQTSISGVEAGVGSFYHECRW